MLQVRLANRRLARVNDVARLLASADSSKVVIGAHDVIYGMDQGAVISIEGERMVHAPGEQLRAEFDESNEPIPLKLTVYNFEVEGFHTYFVGERGLWVHNWDIGAGLA